MRSVSFLDKDIRLHRPQASSERRRRALQRVVRCTTRFRETPGTLPAAALPRIACRMPCGCARCVLRVACNRPVLSGRWWAALTITGPLPLPRDPGVHPVRGAAADAMVGWLRKGFGAYLLPPVEALALKKPEAQKPTALREAAPQLARLQSARHADESQGESERDRPCYGDARIHRIHNPERVPAGCRPMTGSHKSARRCPDHRSFSKKLGAASQLAASSRTPSAMARCACRCAPHERRRWAMLRTATGSGGELGRGRGMASAVWRTQTAG